MSRLWDADALSIGLRDPALKADMIRAFLRGEVRISAHTSVELSLGKPDPEAEIILENLLGSDALLELPEHEDFREAGRRLSMQPRPRGTTSQRKDTRIRRAMDAILASVAWRRGWAVVTNNTKDFASIQEKASEVILSPEDALA